MKYVARKLFTLIITLFIVSLLAFLAFQIIPSDAALSRLGTNATPEQVAQLQHELGLDRSVMVQYGDWLSDFLHGDMGISFKYNMPVKEMIMEKLPLTAVLVLLACFLMVALSFPIGVFTARHAGGVFDRIMTVLNQILMSIPPVFVGILLSFVFGTLFRVFNPGSFVSYNENVLRFLLFMLFPALSIAISRIAMSVKMLRASLLGEMDKNYIRTAYSRGHSRSTALRKHALKNAVIPVIVFIAVSAAEMVAGSIIIEQVFAIPGIGRLLLVSISNRDYPVVQAIVMILAFWVVIVNFLADILSQYIDPRVRLG
ncbi:MAG: nickel/peptide transporter permease protein [Evtepia sp.]|nr:nickel/peptide transporter permease protein [Evtepia sp.]